MAALAEPSGLTWPTVPCCIAGRMDMGCVCGPDERALRGFIQGTARPAMTGEQREWCLDQIGQVEGWKREDHAGACDSLLARAVLDAWVDYCRDKGMM